MTRRSAPRTTGASAKPLLLAACVAGLALPPTALAAAPAPPKGPFKLPLLPYNYTALEPAIDTATMIIHHDRHFAGYVNTLNEALSKAPGNQFASMSLEWLVRAAGTGVLPAEQETTIRNNAGGFYNHYHYFAGMQPYTRDNAPQGELARAIDDAFGNFTLFQAKFEKEAAGRFGSGWAWLVYTADGGLSITSTPNQDSPIMEALASTGTFTGGYPILGVDVWEHAYYILRQNLRADYVKAWWSVVNWAQAEANLAGARQGMRFPATLLKH